MYQYWKLRGRPWLGPNRIVPRQAVSLAIPEEKLTSPWTKTRRPVSQTFLERSTEVVRV